MMQESDLIQGLAKAYAERVVMERCLAVEDACEVGLRPMVAQIRALFAIDAIEKDLGWFCSHEVMTPKRAGDLKSSAGSFAEILRHMHWSSASHSESLTICFRLRSQTTGLVTTHSTIKASFSTRHATGIKPRRPARSAQRPSAQTNPKTEVLSRIVLLE